MSEQRRQRQQVREGVPETKSKKTLVYAVIVILFVGAYFAGRYYKDHKYDAFASCLSSKNAKMYGLYWCPHCAEQKAMFGKAFRYVPYVECAVKGVNGITPACQAAGVKLFPSWQFGANPPKEGVFPLEELSDKTGCALP